MPNRLVSATSPYLLQHADNPVDWWEWGAAAFAEARQRGVPVLVSIGYSTCHWCHVMAHESFEDAATAAYLNERFVSIKVDREERPDIDAIYMEATQAMTGQGGWPMTCVLTAEAYPFFAGTYFPREQRHGMPAFRQVLEAITTAWQERRAEIVGVGADIATHLGQRHPMPVGTTADLGAHAVQVLSRSFDETHAGFGAAPKFPPSMVCEFLLRRAARVDDAEALRLATRTLDAMARGGIYDQLGGGFARYSVDARWDVPHFEKMLYDNALLLRVYVHWHRLTGSALAARVTRETADFMLRELATAELGFASALDADSEGEEGTYYVWTPAELVDVLGGDDAGFAVRAFELTAGGNFERGTSTLRHSDEAGERLDSIRRRLLTVREQRVRPDRDDKVVASWNGLAVAALAEAGVVLGEQRYVEAARATGGLLVGTHLDGSGRLRRVSRDGVPGAPAGVLEDYACVADGFFALFAATGEAQWAEYALALVGQILAHFPDGEGGFFDTPDDAETLLKRPQDPADNASPSGQAMTLTVLTTAAGLTGDAQYADAATALVAQLVGLAERAPRFAGQTLAAWEAIADGPRQVAVVGAASDPRRAALVAAAHRLPHPGQVIAVGDGEHPTVGLLEHRTAVDGRPAAYPCREFVCDLPVSDPAQLS
ncbi:MAG: thioredoxin domain-containing protein [Propionibacteriales bacterium]|nr:thioredoxin domain-containing protein [Propionibacteriales bacterium]